MLRRIARALEAATAGPAGPAATSWSGVLEQPAAAVRAARDELVGAISYVQSAPADLALLALRRFSYLMADALEPALLCEEAGWSLRQTGDARRAAVARRFAQRRLVGRPIRGITDPDRTVIDLFEPLVRYGEIEPAAVLAAAGAGVRSG